MPDAVIVSTARTAIGTSFKGSLLDVDAFELGTLAVAEAVRRAGIDPELVDDEWAPPATTTLSMPDRIDAAALWMALRPDAQCRFWATPGACTSPASMAA